MNYLDDLKRYVPHCEQESADLPVMLEWAAQYADTALSRENKVAHFTSSAMIFNSSGNKILMAYHNLFHSWAWTGGHADGDNDLLQVAIKEAQEETGINGLMPITQEPVSADIFAVSGHIKHGKYVSSHLHLSLCYAFYGDDTLPLRNKPDENAGVKWIDINRLAEYVSEDNMLPIYQKIIQRVKTLMSH